MTGRAFLGVRKKLAPNSWRGFPSYCLIKVEPRTTKSSGLRQLMVGIFGLVPSHLCRSKSENLRESGYQAIRCTRSGFGRVPQRIPQRTVRRH